MKEIVHRIFAIISLSLLVVFTPTVQAQSLTWENYNVIIFNDLSSSSAIQGRTYVGHDITSNSSANFGGQMPSNTATSDRTLVVGNNITSGNPLQLQKGSLYIGGSSNGRTVNYNGGGIFSESQQDSTSLKQSFIGESAAFKLMTADSTVTLPSGGQPGPITFNANPGIDNLAVFNISAASVFGNNMGQTIGLNAGGATNILINVSGTSVNWLAGNMGGDFNSDYWQAHIVWNFYEATSINLGSQQFNGSILAPYATVTTSNAIEGSVVANNLTTTGEVRLPDGNSSSGTSYAGIRVQAVPEPGSALLVGIAGLLFLTRRRSNLRK